MKKDRESEKEKNDESQPRMGSKKKTRKLQGVEAESIFNTILECASHSRCALTMLSLSLSAMLTVC